MGRCPFEISETAEMVVQMEFPQLLVAGQTGQLFLAYTIVFFFPTQFLKTIFACVIFTSQSSLVLISRVSLLSSLEKKFHRSSEEMLQW
jgi:hypothetical protein